MKKKTIIVDDGKLVEIVMDANVTRDGLITLDVIPPDSGGEPTPIGSISVNFARYLSGRLLDAVHQSNLIHLNREIARESRGGE